MQQREIYLKTTSSEPEISSQIEETHLLSKNILENHIFTVGFTKLTRHNFVRCWYWLTHFSIY